MESFVMLKLYTGLKLLLLLSFLSWGYLLIKEREKRVRILLVYVPVIILGLFLFPVSRKLFVAAGLDGETYYRILWTIPMGIIACYGACCFFAQHRRIGLVVSAGLIILCGSYVYKGQYISKAENPYHIPGTVVKICDLIGSGNSGIRVKAVMPPGLIHFVRQYDATIDMPYGREMMVGRWDYYNAVYEVMEKPEVVPVEELLAATREEYCQYIIMEEGRQTDIDPEAGGLVLVDTIGGYRVYQDPVTVEAVSQWQKYYGDEE